MHQVTIHAAITDRTAQAITRITGQDGQDPAQPTSPDPAFSDLTQRPGTPPGTYDHETSGPAGTGEGDSVVDRGTAGRRAG